MSIMNKATILLLICFLYSVCEAQDKPQADTKLADASNAINPAARIHKFQLQPNYSIFHGGGQQLNLMSRFVLPYDGVLLPFIKSKNKDLF